MKKVLLSVLTFMAVASLAYSFNFPFSNQHERSSEKIKVINVLTLTNDEIEKIMQGNSPDVAIEFASGTNLPLQLFLKGDLLNLIENDQAVQIEVKRPFYLRCVKQDILFSANLVKWQPITEFATGSANFALGTADNQTFLKIGADANLRQ